MSVLPAMTGMAGCLKVRPNAATWHAGLTAYGTIGAEVDDAAKYAQPCTSATTQSCSMLACLQGHFKSCLSAD